MNTYKFTGDERDAESNLDHTWFRQYARNQGRWLSPDPTGMAAVDPANPQTPNMYGYVGSAPTQFTDAAGLCPECNPTLDIPDACTGRTTFTYAGIAVYGDGAWIFAGSGPGPSGTVGGLQYRSQIVVWEWAWGQIGTGLDLTNFFGGNGSLLDAGLVGPGDQNSATSPGSNPGQCPSGFGVGLSGGAAFDLGVGPIGATVNGGATAAAFYKGQHPSVNAGVVLSGGTVAYAGRHTAGAPQQGTSTNDRVVIGGFAGIGGGITFF